MLTDAEHARACHHSGTPTTPTIPTYEWEEVSVGCRGAFSLLMKGAEDHHDSGHATACRTPIMCYTGGAYVPV